MRNFQLGQQKLIITPIGDGLTDEICMGLM